MQILRNLPPSYQSMVDVITHRQPFPSFLEAKDMLLLHESRADTIELVVDNLSNSSTALYSNYNTNNSGKTKNKNNRNNNNKNGRNASKGSGPTNVSSSQYIFAGPTGNGNQQPVYYYAPQGHQQQQGRQVSAPLQQPAQGQVSVLGSGPLVPSYPPVQYQFHPSLGPLCPAAHAVGPFQPFALLAAPGQVQQSAYFAGPAAYPAAVHPAAGSYTSAA